MVTWLRTLATIVALAVVPGVLAWSLVDLLADRYRLDAARDQQQELAAVLNRVATLATPVGRINDACRRLVGRGLDPGRLRGRLARLEAAYSDALEIYLFDGAGKLVALPGRPTRSAYVAQQALRAIKDPAASANARLVSRFLGNPQAAGRIAAAPGGLVDLRNGDRLSWGGWWRLKSGIGDVLLLVHRGRIDGDALLDRAVGETQRLLGPHWVVAWQDPLAPQQLRPLAASLSAMLVPALARGEVGVHEMVLLGRPAAVHIAENGARLLIVAPGPAPSRLPLVQLRIAVALGSGLAVLVGLALAAGAARDHLRLRARLIGGFVLVGAIPLAVLLVTALIDRNDREALLVRQYREDQLQLLMRVDGDLSSQMQPILQRYDNVVRRLHTEPARAVGSALSDLGPWAARYGGLIMRLGVVDRRGRLLYFACPEDERDQRVAGAGQRHPVAESFRAYAANILAQTNLDRGAGGSDPAQGVVQIIVGLKGATDWLREQGRLEVNEFNGVSMLSYSDRVRGKSGKARLMFMAMHNSRLVQLAYLRRLQHRFAARSDVGAPRFAAVPLAPGRQWPAFPRPRTEHDPVLQRLRDDAAVSRLPQHRVATVGGRRYLLTAIRGQYIDGYVLVMAQPYDAIVRQIEALDRQLAWFAALMSGLTALAAWITATLLLRPIVGLGQGLRWLQARAFNRRVEPGAVVELAAVADRFNVVMGDLRDLQVARSVQEQLWPVAGLHGADWVVGGRCATAADLGGDHHEWFALPDGRIVFGVGDVAGHGIASALVMASAKVGLAMQSAGAGRPGAMLSAMNASFHALLGRGRPMTFWLGVFDPRSRRLEYACAGHNYPFALSPDGEVKALGVPGYPLGARRHTTYAENVCVLAPGSAVAVYSDGLIEARQPGSTTMFGYDRLAAAVARGIAGVGECGESRPVRVVERVFAEVQAWSTLMVPEDDQTLVVLLLSAGQATVAPAVPS